MLKCDHIDAFDAYLLLAEFDEMCDMFDDNYIDYYWINYDCAFHVEDIEIYEQQYESILNKPIPDNNLKYSKDKIKTLKHLRWYSGKITELGEQSDIEAIEILTGINIWDRHKKIEEERKDDFKNMSEEEIQNAIIQQIKEEIETEINKMSTGKLKYRMKQLVAKLQSYYLPKLYRWEKQILDITTFISLQVYSTNAAYQEVFSYANKQKHDLYDKKSKTDLNQYMQKFNSKYK